MEVETPATIECSSCQHPNEAGMLFCTKCGNGLTKNAERVRTKTLAIGYKCPQCHKTDELNVRFCVFCGHRLNANSQSGMFELSQIVAPEKRKTAAFASFERAINQKNLLDLSARVASSFNYASGALLATLLVIAIYIHMPQQAKPDFFVFTDRDAQLSLSLANQQLSSATDYLKGRADSNGHFSFGRVAPGNYMLQISDISGRTIVAPITVPADQKVTVGWPKRPVHISARDKN
jgi:hypothetical protein